MLVNGLKSDGKIERSVSDFKEGGNLELKLNEIKEEMEENIDVEHA